jgi:hypothetical protein
VRSNAPTTGDWVAIEEGSSSLQENRSRLVEAESLPEASIDARGINDTVALDVAVVGGSVQASAWATNIA